jgi:hypothetical protein
VHGGSELISLMTWYAATSLLIAHCVPGDQHVGTTP